MKLGQLIPLAVLLCTSAPVFAQPIDFTEFEVESYPLTNGFPEAVWEATASEARIDEAPLIGSPNASVNVFYGPDNALGKRFVGQMSPGPRDGRAADDDVVGFVLGFEPGDADLFSDDALDANYVLIDWKGTNQSFNFEDPPGGDFFHGATVGGPMPAGLAISHIRGLPTADELWQHVDSEDGIDGGVTELARARSLGNAGYDRSADAEPYTFEISYTANRVTVVVDGAVELDVDGDFEDGRFGLYTLSQGPTPVFSDFEMFEATSLPTAFPSVRVDRATGELTIENEGATATQFERYSIRSSAGSLEPAAWRTVTDNYDQGVAGSIDGDAWQVDSATATALGESEADGSNGASLAGSQSISLGNVWIPSRFEDITVEFELADGLIVPAVPNFVGNQDAPFQRSDLNTDGVINADDWSLFYPNALKEFEGMTLAEAALSGDLDGDLDNDVVDFGLFKADFEAALGAGAFAAMAAGVPEPSNGFMAGTAMVLALALAGHRRRRRRLGILVVWAVLTIAAGERPAFAQPLNFDDFTVERFPPTGGFAEAEWDSTGDTATIAAGANASTNVFYSPDNVLGKRIRGFLDPSTDDDIVGFVFGFQPGDASFGDDSADADYLLLDWKGTDQTFDFNDPVDPDPEFNNLTGGGFIPAGLALSRVTGLANSDELWQHDSLEGNPLGGVQELARGVSLGFTGYDRDPASELVEFDVTYTADQVVVLVNGRLEFLESGEFSDGRFGLYTGWQSNSPTFFDFEVSDASTLELSKFLLFVEANRETGDIVISNDTDESVAFDFYQLASESGSLLSEWTGLADQETGGDAEAGSGWVEAGGSRPDSIGELFLMDAAGNTGGRSLAPGSSFTLSGAYNTALNGEDLAFDYRLPDGTLSSGFVTYTGEVSLSGDCNGNGRIDFEDLSCSNLTGTTEIVLTQLALLPGDLDGQDGVGFSDFLILSTNFNLASNVYTQGDIDGDGTVGFADFLVLSTNFGQSAAMGAAVPEPTGWSLSLAVLLCLWRQRRAAGGYRCLPPRGFDRPSRCRLRG